VDHLVSPAYGLILAGVVLNAVGQLLLKAGTNAVGRYEFAAHNFAPVAARLAFEPHIIGGILCYLASLVVWLMGLSRLDVTIAYPMLSLGYVLNAVAAWYLLGESLGVLRIAGIGFIVVGVFLIARS
jgi:multidrug transporter EmrE-like cation transporter